MNYRESRINDEVAFSIVSFATFRHVSVEIEFESKPCGEISHIQAKISISKIRLPTFY